MFRNLGNGGPPSPCPEGTTWNGNACVCPPGSALDTATMKCVSTTVCPTNSLLVNGVCVCVYGTHLNAEGTACIPDDIQQTCSEGFHENAYGTCVPDEKASLLSGNMVYIAIAIVALLFLGKR